jgi:hypothetical protein
LIRLAPKQYEVLLLIFLSFFHDPIIKCLNDKCKCALTHPFVFAKEHLMSVNSETLPPVQDLLAG